MSAGEELDGCIAAGGIALFPSDTVYGLACDPESPAAIDRLYALKGRPPAKAAAVMFFQLEAALDAVPELGSATRDAIAHLLPGAVTVLLGNPARRFPLAGGADPETLGLRVVSVPVLAGARTAVLQTSANLAGGPDARRLEEVPEAIRAAVDLVIDGGELPGTPSTVLDLRRFEHGGIDAVRILRAGAVGEQEIATALAGQYHFNPATYLEMMRADYPGYDAFQDTVVDACGDGARKVLELGTGTGETARRLLDRHPRASLVGVDESAPMLERARERIDGNRSRLVVGQLQDPLPEGPFDLVVSALCVHHLDGPEKADLFRRIGEVLVPGGRFVLGDVVLPEDRSAATMPLTPGFDKPSTASEQLGWLDGAGFDARVVWDGGEVVVIAAALRT